MYSTPINVKNSIDLWKDQYTFAQSHPQFSRSQISYLLRNRKLNGLDKIGAVKKIGRKLYIHELRFSSWIEATDQESAA